MATEPQDHPKPLIRDVAPADRPRWNELWLGYVTFYKAVVPPETTEITWQRLHDPQEPVYGLVAELGGEVVGITHYLFHRSTWSPTLYCYLEDLFTAEAARGHGVGTALIEEVARRAKAKDARRLYWSTHETNTRAQRVYDVVGQRSGFIQYRKALPQD